MADTTAILGLPYPTVDDTPDVPRDIEALAETLDTTVAPVPVGALLLWATATPPTNYLICIGQTVAAATYPALEAVLGSTGGNITLPDLRDRVPVGVSGTRALRSTAGAATHVLSTSEIPAHTHSSGDGGSFVVYGGGVGNVGAEAPYQMHTSTTTTSVGGGSAHNNMQPYIALNYIIRAA